MKAYESLGPLLKEHDFEPFNTQVAVAITAWEAVFGTTSSLAKKKAHSTIMEVGAGQGKCIITAILAGLILKMDKSDIDTIIIAFPTDVLMEKDLALYQKLQDTFPDIKIYPVDSV